MLKTKNNPGGLPISAFDQIRTGVVADRSQFFKDLSIPFYGYNKPGAKMYEAVRDAFWRQGMQAYIKGVYDCIKAFSETDFTEDLEKIDVPTLILQGDADQIVPIDDASRLSAKLVKNSTLKVYPVLRQLDLERRLVKLRVAECGEGCGSSLHGRDESLLAHYGVRHVA